MGGYSTASAIAPSKDSSKVPTDRHTSYYAHSRKPRRRTSPAADTSIHPTIRKSHTPPPALHRLPAVYHRPELSAIRKPSTARKSPARKTMSPSYAAPQPDPPPLAPSPLFSPLAPEDEQEIQTKIWARRQDIEREIEEFRRVKERELREFEEGIAQGGEGAHGEGYTSE